MPKSKTAHVGGVEFSHWEKSTEANRASMLEHVESVAAAYRQGKESAQYAESVASEAREDLISALTIMGRRTVKAGKFRVTLHREKRRQFDQDIAREILGRKWQECMVVRQPLRIEVFGHDAERLARAAKLVGKKA